METYIINPMVFYWMDVAAVVDKTASFLVFLLAIMLMAFVAIEMMCEGDDDEKVRKYAVKARKITFAVLICSSLLATFIPSPDSLTKMLIAKYSTVENVTAVTEQGKALVEFLTEQVIKVTESAKQ